MAGLGSPDALSVQQEDLLVARVGPHFVGLFYNALENQRGLMRNFFADTAKLVWNGNTCYTKEDIGKFYDSLPACRIDVICADGEAFLHQGQRALGLVVGGLIKFLDDGWVQFKEVFVLTGENNGWKVAEDTFCLQGPVPQRD
ncbi:hypothetical protein MRX96_008742 [Rhipicephalus microplus]|uniref:NTF2-related export protein n=1 Tax=Rhipicephalus microplus TaxID=6941 RepID=A0A9J6DD99_RHIMP|nr:NTF2-related export protein-like [Rhipicephalus microplus]KAH8019970.1 hypothetical protein HPB51_023635 [Rhipicephalus microplus]